MKLKYKAINFFVILIATSMLFPACEGSLDPVIYDQIAPTNFFKTKGDVNSAVTGIYAELGGNVHEPTIYGEIGTDEYWANWGGQEILNFDWRKDTQSKLYSTWIPAVTRAGNLIEIIKGLTFLDEKDKVQFLSEVRVLRAMFMFDLLRWYGPSAVILDSKNLLVPDNSYKPARPSLDSPEGIKFRADYEAFIEQELIESAAKIKRDATEFGRMDQGTALTLLMKFYMFKKDWTNVVTISQQLLDLEGQGKYELMTDYNSIWTLSNERNKEIIMAIPRSTNELGQNWRTRTLKTEYDISDETKWDGDKIRFEFLDQFDTLDARRINIIDRFTNKAGKVIDMRDGAYQFNGAFSLKYGRDPNAKQNSGVDCVILRYADVLLCRAEALNELDGPTAESINLVNRIRTRAKLNSIESSNFSKESFRDQILKERGFEFWMEGLRRDDLIRQEKYISFAHNRGASLAQDFMTLYPIPEIAIQENENIHQNPGYNF